MPNTDREMWQVITAYNENDAEFNYLTYSIYAFEKYDWVQSFEKKEGKPPTSQDIDRWIGEITDRRIDSWRETAARLFDAAAKAYMTSEIEQKMKQAVDQSILKEIKKAGVWWRQIGIALITAVLAPLIIGLMIIGARSYDLFVPTATDVSNKAHTPPSKEQQQPQQHQ